MARPLKGEQVEQLVAQLPSSEQLKLVARMGEQISASTVDLPDAARRQPARAAEVQQWLAECDALAGDEGIFG